MILDLSFNAKLNSDFASDFEEIANNSREEFNEYISFISEPFKQNLDWWVLSPPSRNTYASSLFHYFCVIKFTKLILSKKKFKNLEIIIDSKVLKRAIERLLIKEKKLKIKIILKKNNFKKFFFKNGFRYKFIFIKRVIRLILARVLNIFFNTKLPKKSITLLDTFVSPEYLNNDRWYGVLWEKLNNSQKSQVFFVPTVINTSIINFFKVISSLKRNERNNFIKEDYLNIEDLFFAYNHRKRVKKIQIKPFKLFGIDLTEIVREEILYYEDIDSIFEALLTYRFLGGLSRKGINIKNAYDWFEGHSIYKAWNLVISKFHKGSKKIGYRAFFKSYPLYLSTYPIQIEKVSGVLPDIFALQGEGSEEDLKEFDNSLKTFLIPAFKSEYITNWNFEENLAKKNILVALPISIEASIRIIKILIKESKKISLIDKDIKIILKTHPTNSNEIIKKKLLIDIPKNYIFTEEKYFSKLLKESFTLITEASSTALESLACGVPVLIIKNNKGFTYDPLPKNLSEIIVKKVSSSNDIFSALSEFYSPSKKNRETIKKMAANIRSKYFQPVTKNGIENFIDPR